MKIGPIIQFLFLYSKRFPSIKSLPFMSWIILRLWIFRFESKTLKKFSIQSWKFTFFWFWKSFKGWKFTIFWWGKIQNKSRDKWILIVIRIHCNCLFFCIRRNPLIWISVAFSQKPDNNSTHCITKEKDITRRKLMPCDNWRSRKFRVKIQCKQ